MYQQPQDLNLSSMYMPNLTPEQLMPQTNYLPQVVNDNPLITTPLASKSLTATPQATNPIQQMLQKYLPNTAQGIGQDYGAVRDTLQAGLDQTKAGWGTLNYGQKGNALLGGAQGLYGLYSGYKAGKRADEQFDFQKKAFNKNFDAQAKTTNAALSDRQAARVARDPNQHTSVKDYMKKYGV